MSIWKKLLIVLLCLLLLGSIAFLLLQDRILGPDGGIELPWKKENTADEQKEIEKLPEGQLVIIIEEPRRPETKDMCAQELGAEVLRGGTESALAALEESGANALVVRVKDSAGRLYYSSAIPEAAQAGAVVGNAVSDGAISDLVGSKYYTIARIAALHDSAFAYRYPADAAVLQLQYPGVVWYDPDSTFWIAPEKELTRSYLAGIAAECASLGFDELLFDEFAYPSNGRQSNIDVSAREMSMEDALKTLAAELQNALADSKTKLSLELDAQTILNGGNEKKGQDIETLSRYFDRIYVETSEAQFPALAEVFKDLDTELIPILSEARDEGSCLLKEK